MVTGGYDVAVIGAGVFGAWTSYQLQRSGARVVLLDSFGPGNSRASSGGESRIIRMGYGPNEIYTLSAQRSLKLWRDLFSQIGSSLQTQGRTLERHSLDPLFHQTGVLWLARETDSYSEATLATLSRTNVHFQRLDRSELQSLYPQLELGTIHWGILEPDSGVFMARQAVRAVVEQARIFGASWVNEAVLPPMGKGQIESLATVTGREIRADTFVFACGPWLPKLFPEVLGELIHVTRQEVFFFGVPAERALFAPPHLPVWIDFNDLMYAIPDVDGRGVKIAIDAHGPDFDPDNGERIVTKAGVNAARRYLSSRMPALKQAPLVDSRICQYENTSNGDFLIDLHPDFENLWLVGGGSGHGFKHGPTVGEYVAEMIAGNAEVQSRFTLETKAKIRERKIY